MRNYESRVRHSGDKTCATLTTSLPTLFPASDTLEIVANHHHSTIAHLSNSIELNLSNLGNNIHGFGNVLKSRHVQTPGVELGDVIRSMHAIL